MKTLKQIREEYDNNFITQVDNLPEEMVLEDTFKPRDVIPSAKEMPSLLVFRRVSFRSYPKGQVVALYYSKTLDKYLSIPFGPAGNLNLSETSVYDTLEELDLTEGAKWNAVKGAVKGAAHGAVRGFALGASVGHLPGATAGTVIGAARGAYKGVKSELDKEKTVKESFKDRYRSLREGQVDEGLMDIVKKGVNILKKGVKAVVGAGDSDYSGTDGGEKAVEINKDTKHISEPKARISSSWKSRTGTDPVYQSKLKQASIAPIKENKIADIRDMIDSGDALYEMNINGRLVTLNTSMAKRILEVYDSVNTKNKKIVESMLNEDLESFKKLLNFSVRN